MTNLFKKEIEEVKKGCGYCSISQELLNLRPNADVSKWTCHNSNLCQECKEKLSTLETCEKIVSEKVEMLKKSFCDYPKDKNCKYEDCNCRIIDKIFGDAK